MSMLQKIIVSGTTPSYPSQWYYADTPWTAKTVSGAADRYKLISPDAVQVDVGGVSLTQYSSQSLDLSIASNWDDYADDSDWDSTEYSTAANRVGLDFYVYAVAPVEGSLPRFLLSANATYPIGYNSETSRKVCGFHCLCVSVGTISGHTLTGYVAGDILPASVWCLNHKSQALCGNIGQVYDSAIQRWVGIYFISGSASVPTNVFGGTILDTITWNDSVDALFKLGMRLPRDAEFQSFAEGSNQETNISGNADPVTVKGSVDTAGRRMISNIGVEGCCGQLWQWLDEQSYRFDGATAHTHSVTVSGESQTVTSAAASADVAPAWGWYDLGSKGSLYKQGTYGDAKLFAGGSWNAGTHCGSRSRSLDYSRWCTYSYIGVRGVAPSVER